MGRQKGLRNMVSVKEAEVVEATSSEQKSAEAEASNASLQAFMGRELKKNEEGENCWTEMKPEDVPEGSMGAAKVAQAAVLVQACHHATSADDAADALTSLCDLGREKPGGPDALLEAEVLEAAIDALERLDTPTDLAFLVADLARMVSQKSPVAVTPRVLGALVSVMQREPEQREMYMAVAMICHHLLHGGLRGVLVETAAEAALVAGLESQEMRADVSVVQHGLAVLAAAALRADSGPDPVQLIAVELCVRQHLEEAVVQRQGLRFMAAGAMHGFSLPNSVQLSIAALEQHSTDATVCAPALSLLAALPRVDEISGKLGVTARAVQLCIASKSESPAVHGMMLLMRILEGGGTWSDDQLEDCVRAVCAAADAWHGKDEPMIVAMMVSSRLARIEMVRPQLIEQLLPKMTMAVESCEGAQPWAPALQALMELAQDGGSVRAANAGGLAFVVAALERYGKAHSGVAADGLLALWMMQHPEVIGRNTPLWLRATEIAVQVVAAHPNEPQLEEALRRLDN